MNLGWRSGGKNRKEAAISQGNFPLQRNEFPYTLPLRSPLVRQWVTPMKSTDAEGSGV